ncbi:MAG: hypothetical protein KJP14_07615 [Eudoraea sp.]|nr:hypothetical protein [Eudoraea sp.]MBT8210378.1 hypothetical protein [Eudoraea sp.]NNK29811.1 hypothetical protein [Flavobacteriaceae bacterium]
MHYKNWIQQDDDALSVLTGFYFREIPYAELDEVTMVKRIPEMERINGFSAWEKEKGIFMDSLRPDNSIYVYVDNLNTDKIKLRYKDSLEIYLNLSDSVKTNKLFLELKDRMAKADKQ